MTSNTGQTPGAFDLDVADVAETPAQTVGRKPSLVMRGGFVACRPLFFGRRVEAWGSGSWPSGMSCLDGFNVRSESRDASCDDPAMRRPRYPHATQHKRHRERCEGVASLTILLTTLTYSQQKNFGFFPV